MFVIVVIGTLLILFNSLRHRADQGEFFLAASFFGPLLLMGFVQSASLGAFRYNFFLNPVFVMIFSLTLVRIARGAGALALRTRSPDGLKIYTAHQPMSPSRKFAIMGFIAAGLFFCCEQMDLRQALAVSQRGYGLPEETLRDPGVANFYRDLKTPAQYVDARRSAEDLVIVRTAFEVFPYIGRSDFALRGSDWALATLDDHLVDWYVGVPIVSSVEEFRAILKANSERRIWIISSEETSGITADLPQQILTLVRRLDGHRVYTGRDGVTFVLKIDPLSSLSWGE